MSVGMSLENQAVKYCGWRQLAYIRDKDYALRSPLRSAVNTQLLHLSFNEQFYPRSIFLVGIYCILCPSLDGNGYSMGIIFGFVLLYKEK